MNPAGDRDRTWRTRAFERKHLALLIAVIILQSLHPLLAHWSAHTRILVDIIFAIVVVGVLLAIFERRRERWLAICLAIPGVAGNLGHYLLPEHQQILAAILYNCSLVAFFGFAVIVILKGVFRRRVVRFDDIIGAACGYLLAGIAWGSLYTLVNVLAPGSFSVPYEIAWQLDNWHTKHALFIYFSVVSLTGLGYGDITPVSPPVYALVSLEVLFGLFYLAVVVSQLVSLMIIRRRDDNPSP